MKREGGTSLTTQAHGTSPHRNRSTNLFSRHTPIAAMNELLGVVPSGAADIKLARGCRARVEALRQRNDLNGAIVDVQREAGGGRWICRTLGGETISVNETNLVVTAGWSLAALIMPAACSSASDAEIEEDTLRWIAAPLGLSDITALALADDHESLTPRHVSLIVAACTRLQSLDLSTCQSAVTDDGLGSLGRLPALTELDVSQTAVSDEGLRLLAEGPPVESREVRNGERSRGLYASLGAALGGSIAGLRQLESLSLRRCIHITDEGLLHIAQHCPSLRALDLSGCGPKRERSQPPRRRAQSVPLHRDPGQLPLVVRHCHRSPCSAVPSDSAQFAR